MSLNKNIFKTYNQSLKYICTSHNRRLRFRQTRVQVFIVWCCILGVTLFSMYGYQNVTVSLTLLQLKWQDWWIRGLLGSNILCHFHLFKFELLFIMVWRSPALYEPMLNCHCQSDILFWFDCDQLKRMCLFKCTSICWCCCVSVLACVCVCVCVCVCL